MSANSVVPGLYGVDGNPFLPRTGIQKKHPFRKLWGLGRPLKVAGLGDSIMDGNGASGGYNAFGRWLSKACFTSDGKLVCNVYGYSGMSAVGHRGVGYKDDYLQFSPDVVVYHLGHNDPPNSPTDWLDADFATFQAAVLATLAEIWAAGVKVVILPALIYTTGKLQASMDRANAWYRELARDDDRILFVGDFVGFDSLSPTGNETGTRVDGIHPNYAGSNAMAGIFWAWLKPYLAGVTSIHEYIPAVGVAAFGFENVPVGTPYQSGLGGGSGYANTETLLSGATPEGGNGVRVAYTTGTNTHIVGNNFRITITATAAQKYMMVVRYKTSQTLVANRRTLEFNTYVDPGTANIVNGITGMVETNGEWHTAIWFNITTATSTHLNGQLFVRELLPTESNVAGSIDMAEVLIGRIAALEAALPSVPWGIA